MGSKRTTEEQDPPPDYEVHRASSNVHNANRPHSSQYYNHAPPSNYSGGYGGGYGYYGNHPGQPGYAPGYGPPQGYYQQGYYAQQPVYVQQQPNRGFDAGDCCTWCTAVFAGILFFDLLSMCLFF